MKKGCPNLHCLSYQSKKDIVRDGSYFRKNDSRYIRRFKCKCCGKRFSASSGTLEFNQKKRRINFAFFKLYCSGVSIRRSAKILGVNKNTIPRKIEYLAKKARLSQSKFLEALKDNPLDHIQFDDLITKEHTKLKPLSVSTCVDPHSRKILSADVSKIPSFGQLAHISRKKYGYRKSTHMEVMNKVFFKITPSLSKNVRIDTDEHKHYPILIKKHLPYSTHNQYLSKRGSLIGQGEV